MYFLRPDAFEVIAGLRPSARGELEITELLNHYVSSGAFMAHRYEGEWSDAGTAESLLVAARLASNPNGSPAADG